MVRCWDWQGIFYPDSVKQKAYLEWVSADSGGWYPQAEKVIGNVVYLRFHGPAELYASSYPLKTLRLDAQKAQAWLREGKQVWAFFNNDVNCYAVKNALSFKKLVLCV